MRLILTGLMFVLASSTCLAGPLSSKDPHSIDILGLHLGMPSNEATKVAASSIKATRTDENTKILKMGSFTAPPITFGVNLERDTNRGAVEVLDLVYSDKPGIGLIFIGRRSDFQDQDQNITREDLEKTLVDKYGPPSYRQSGDNRVHGMTPVGRGYTELYWIYKTTVKLPSGDHFEFASDAGDCAAAFEFGNVTNMIGGPIEAEPATHSKCGTWMKAVIIENRQQPSMAGSLQLALGDFSAIAESREYFVDYMRKGAASSQLTGGDKPKL